MEVLKTAAMLVCSYDKRPSEKRGAGIQLIVLPKNEKMNKAIK